MSLKKKKIATNIPASLLSQATRMSGLNQTAAIIEGLQELVRREQIKRLLSHEGKLSLKVDLAHSRGRSS